MRKEMLAGLIFFALSCWGIFATESVEEEMLYRSPESRYAMSMDSREIIDELHMTIAEIERVQNDKEKVRELSEDVFFYISILEQKGEVIPTFAHDF